MINIIFKKNIRQFVKFLAVGILNTLIDLGVLNVLIFLTAAAAGWQFAIFKGISFSAAVLNSYFWNKFWTFKDRKKIRVAELSQFFVISAGGFIVNVGVASFVVNIVGPMWGFPENIWANVGAIFAIGFSLIWNFLGYKFIVFKDKS